MSDLLYRPRAARHQMMGITPPPLQDSWRGDNEWLEFGPSDSIADDNFNLRVAGGVDDEERPCQEAAVLLSATYLPSGQHTELEIKAQAARELGQLLIKAADAAEAEMRKKSGWRTNESLMEERRAEYHRNKARENLTHPHT